MTEGRIVDNEPLGCYRQKICISVASQRADSLLAATQDPKRATLVTRVGGNHRGECW
jgi:hypothetical protein